MDVEVKQKENNEIDYVLKLEEEDDDSFTHEDCTNIFECSLGDENQSSI